MINSLRKNSQESTDALDSILFNGIEKTMNRINS